MENSIPPSALALNSKLFPNSKILYPRLIWFYTQTSGKQNFPIKDKGMYRIETDIIKFSILLKLQ